ncbi:TPA: LPD7 domain-containing protein [Yersinia enterocolitica]
MLIRQGGGRDGIKEYLENGLKSSNTIHRDILDKRIVLEGELDVTDKIIKSIDNSGERYSHYTLSFKEDTVTPEILQEVTEQFKKFLLHAYTEDEFDFYAEAHLPKVKSYIDKKTGNTILRKPHIHVVVPKVNVLSGEYINPLGFYKHNQKYIEALQETLNIDINLESPKDNKRNYLNDVSEIISRYKGDFFQSDARRLKEKILADIINNKIGTWADFNTHLLCIGDVIVRNKTKKDEYLNIKSFGEKKGVNLKENFFSREFIELTHEEKVSLIVSKSKKQSTEEKRVAYLKYKSDLDIWYSRRSHEIKYLNPSSKEYKEYKKLSIKQKQSLINEKINTHQLKMAYIKDSCFGVCQNNGLLQRMLNNSNQGTTNVVYTKQVTKVPPTLRRNRMRSLSECGVVGFSKRSEVLLPNNVSCNVGNGNGGRHNNVRWTIHNEGVDNVEHHLSSFRISDNVTEALLQQLQEERISSTKFEPVDWNDIQSRLDLNLFLDTLSISHGVIRENYTIVKNKRGLDRVKCGNRQFTINDFLTKEINLDWITAKLLIEDEFKHQSINSRHTARQSPKTTFWVDFKEWQKLPQNSYKQIWQLQRESEKNRRMELNEVFANRRRAIFGISTNYSDRQAKLSLLRMEKVRAQQSLRSVLADEHLHLKQRLTIDEQYISYLQSLSSGGNIDALEELRRYNTYRQAINRDDFSIKTTQIPPYSALLNTYNYKVKKNGNVMYFINNKKAIEDTREWVSVLEQNDDDAIEVALRLAVEKNYHKPVELTGSNEFKRHVVEVSVNRGVSVTFISVELQDLRNKCLEEQRQANLDKHNNNSSKNNLKQ